MNIPSAKQLKQREANVKRTTTTLMKSLKEQKRLGNIKPEYNKLMKNSSQLKKLVENMYNDPNIDEIKNKTKALTELFTKTGGIVSEGISKRTGKVYLKPGREIKNLYKQLKQRMKNSGVDEITVEREEIVGYEGKQRIFGKKEYKFQNPKTMQDFISQLNGKAAVVALRIDLGEPREEVLRDYGY